LKAVKSKNLGITFDLTHAYQHGTKKPVEFLDAHRKDIYHVHISGYSKIKNHVPFHMTEMPVSYLDKVLKKLVEYHKDIIAIEGDIKRIMKVTKTAQKMVVKKNLDYIHKELKSLHLI
jgi:sugar phosphate isomerase/epimerase